MIQGTGSYVGKSVVTAALCRHFRQQGFRVAPFKAQNMSNNSYVTPEGREIGRAQAFQAQACGIEPSVEMNPVLLKPASDTGAQVVVLGKAVKVMNPREYHAHQPHLIDVIRASLEKLSRENDIVILEGAGSPAEINLRPFDIVNMRVAKMASAPVVLVGDINLGGVFAWLVGTLDLLRSEERSLVKGLLINKFLGDISLLESGLKFLEERTGKKVLRVLPFLHDLAVSEEDDIPEMKMKNRRPPGQETLTIQVIRLPHISNPTDFDALETEPDVSLRYLAHVPHPKEALPDLLLLPGSKSTVADLAYLKSSGLAGYIHRCHTGGAKIIGLCGGYQMLGKELLDPDRVESTLLSMEGLGLLDTMTTFEAEKTTLQIRAESLKGGEEIIGYEIHMGKTEPLGSSRPLFKILEHGGKPASRFEGTASEDGSVWGTYLHGVFDAPAFRRQMLNSLRHRKGWAPVPATSCNSTEKALDRLAQIVRDHVDLGSLEGILNGTS